MGLPSGPSAIPAVRSLALIAPTSASYSTNAIPLRPGTVRTSRKPSNAPKMFCRCSLSTSSGKFCKKRILFGGRYSSGITAPAAGLDDLSPAPRVDLMGRAASAAETSAGRFFCSATAASLACFRSEECQLYNRPMVLGRAFFC